LLGKELHMRSTSHQGIALDLVLGQASVDSAVMELAKVVQLQVASAARNHSRSVVGFGRSTRLHDNLRQHFHQNNTFHCLGWGLVGLVDSVGSVGSAGLAMGQNQAASAAQAAAAAAAAAQAAAAGNPYSGYSLTNVDMSSFQGVDWSSIYGMGMYV